MPKRTKSLAGIGLLLLALALLAGCGSGSSSGSDQFRGKTKSPLLDFGEEGSETGLKESEEVVESFLSARAKGSWPEACAQISQPMLEKIEHLATSATELSDTSCASFLDTFSSVSASERKSTKIIAASLREEGEEGFLIYSAGAKEVVYAMPLGREGNAWKVAALAPKELS